MKKLFIFLTLIVLSSYLLIPISVRAIEEAQAESATVTATVDSKVSIVNSKIELNTQETLADPSSHSVLITIILKDADKQPLPNINVVVTSNRGEVDIIEAISKLGSGKAHAAEISDMQKDKTDKDGKVAFRITSFVPGKAILSVTADALVHFDPIEILFDPLPFPTNITVTIPIPGTDKEITLYSPKPQETEQLSALQVDSYKLVNTGTKMKISYWYLVIFALIIIGLPLFVVLNFINLRKIRRMEKEQTLLLKKMFPPNYNRHQE